MTDTTQPASLNPSRDSQAPLVPGSSQEQTATEERARKRDFFRFGKKDDDKKKAKSSTTGISNTASSGGLRPVSPLPGPTNPRSPGSPGLNSPYGGVRSASPRTHSPASSMIFERNVQEDVAVPQASPQIPSHLITENHIAPALDATSEAITDRRLNPDTVEIVTHSAHQPAAVTISEGTHEAPVSPVLSDDNLGLTSTHSARGDPIADASSNYANLDPRRLSFISFADVVHGEHDFTNEGRRDSAAITSHPSIYAPRSPSPLHSPIASPPAAGTSPPTSHETSPHRGGAALGDLNIETMRQALRSPGSGDLSGFRSAALSAVNTEENLAERSFR